MATPQSYLVTHAAGAVIDDGSQSTHYAHGTTFVVHPNNPSLLRALSARKVMAASGQAQSASVQIGGSVSGPPGPAGPPGETVASLFSCKVRTLKNLPVMPLHDTGAPEPVRFGVFGEEVFDPADMFNPTTGNDKIVVKSGAQGRYRADAHASFTFAPRGYRQAEIVLYDSSNNIKDRLPVCMATAQGSETALAFGSVFDARIGDYFRLEVKQSSGETLRVGASLAVTYVGSPTSLTNGARIAATNEWLAALARLAQLPPQVSPDPYELVRARFAAEASSAHSRAEALGGLA